MDQVRPESVVTWTVSPSISPATHVLDVGHAISVTPGTRMSKLVRQDLPASVEERMAPNWWDPYPYPPAPTAKHTRVDGHENPNTPTRSGSFLETQVFPESAVTRIPEGIEPDPPVVPLVTHIVVEGQAIVPPYVPRPLALCTPAPFEPAWDPRRLYTLEARMEPWTRSALHRRGIRLS